MGVLLLGLLVAGLLVIIVNYLGVLPGGATTIHSLWRRRQAPGAHGGRRPPWAGPESVGQPSASMMVALAIPPPSHIVCSP
jgi:hypothetical protein